MQRELNDLGGAKELALYRLKIAKEDLAAAERCYEAQDYRAANNRAYYAIFRAVSACLALEFKAYKQHGQVLGELQQRFCAYRHLPEGYRQEDQPCAGGQARERLQCFLHGFYQ